MRWLLNKMPLTRLRICLARGAYHIIHLLLRTDRRIITRSGIRYEVDLSEAIDLSVFLLGHFQKHVSENKRLSLPEDAVIFDVGANVGTMTLPYAKLVPAGKVYAFEPTFFAFTKLMRNLELNPELAERVVPVQSFVSSSCCAKPDIRAYASWKLAGAFEAVRHGVHGGATKATNGIGAITLDGFCERNGIARLDFMKIDTDGHELQVLEGARESVATFRPLIIFEAGLYLMEEGGITFADFASLFGSLGYCLFDSRGRRKIDVANYRRHIPRKSTIDILAVPTTKL
ncbi:MAG: FkbM family methyltransferase [Gemmatimonadetes bacterium]|nr:FkbM family methyltransferase [Gemmatimonadota bacterium]